MALSGDVTVAASASTASAAATKEEGGEKGDQDCPHSEMFEGVLENLYDYTPSIAAVVWFARRLNRQRGLDDSLENNTRAVMAVVSFLCQVPFEELESKHFEWCRATDMEADESDDDGDSDSNSESDDDDGASSSDSSYEGDSDGEGARPATARGRNTDGNGAMQRIRQSTEEELRAVNELTCRLRTATQELKSMIPKVHAARDEVVQAFEGAIDDFRKLTLPDAEVEVSDGDKDAVASRYASIMVDVMRRGMFGDDSQAQEVNAHTQAPGQGERAFLGSAFRFSPSLSIFEPPTLASGADPAPTSIHPPPPRSIPADQWEYTVALQTPLPSLDHGGTSQGEEEPSAGARVQGQGQGQVTGPGGMSMEEPGASWFDDAEPTAPMFFRGDPGMPNGGVTDSVIEGHAGEIVNSATPDDLFMPPALRGPGGADPPGMDNQLETAVVLPALLPNINAEAESEAEAGVAEAGADDTAADAFARGIFLDSTAEMSSFNPPLSQMHPAPTTPAFDRLVETGGYNYNNNNPEDTDAETEDASSSTADPSRLRPAAPPRRRRSRRTTDRSITITFANSGTPQVDSSADVDAPPADTASATTAAAAE